MWLTKCSSKFAPATETQVTVDHTLGKSFINVNKGVSLRLEKNCRHLEYRSFLLK